MGRTQYERDEEDLIERLNRGEISPAEYNKQMRALQRWEREGAIAEREEAHERLDRDMGWDHW